MTKFIRDFIITLIAGVVAVLLIAHLVLEKSVPLSLWLCIAFISIATVIVHYVLIQANEMKRPQLFVAYFMGTLTGKMFLSLMLLLVVGLVDRPHLKFTAVAYFAFYVALTFVELKHLLPLVRGKKD